MEEISGDFKDTSIGNSKDICNKCLLGCSADELIAQDEAAAVYTEILEAIETYIEKPDEETRLETIEILKDAGETIGQTEV